MQVTVADPGFSEWEGILFGQMRVCLQFLTKTCMKMTEFTQNWGGGMCPAHPLIRSKFDVKNL